MATFNTVGLDELELDMEKILAIPDSVKKEMVQAGAEVIAEEQRKQVPKKSNTLHDSIAVNKPRVTKDGAYADVVFEGDHHTSKKSGRVATNAEVAYVIENGVARRNIPPNPFIRRSNEIATGRAVDAEMKVYDEWLKQNNF